MVFYVKFDMSCICIYFSNVAQSQTTSSSDKAILDSPLVLDSPVVQNADVMPSAPTLALDPVFVPSDPAFTIPTVTGGSGGFPGENPSTTTTYFTPTGATETLTETEAPTIDPSDQYLGPVLINILNDADPNPKV